jgi:hypothetical protein
MLAAVTVVGQLRADSRTGGHEPGGPRSLAVLRARGLPILRLLVLLVVLAGTTYPVIATCAVRPPRTAGLPEHCRHHPGAPAARRRHGWRAVPVDMQLECRLVDRIREDPRTRLQRISVQVQNRVAILRGVATFAAACSAASDVAWHTEGILDVSNQLEAPPRRDV